MRSGSESSTMFSYVYVLISTANRDLYIGYTTDLKRRYAEHQNGRSQYTKSTGPWELIYYEAHLDPEDSKRREKYLKTTVGNRALRRMLRNELSRRSTT